MWNTFQAREMELVSFTVRRIKITEMMYVCVRACVHLGAAVESTMQAIGCCP